MKKYISILYFLLSLSAWAQQKAEKAYAFPDKELYLVGETMHVAVDVQDATSRVAYVELSDTKQMYAGALVALKGGKGWCDISLPTAMHSGNYQLTAYTRQMLAHADAQLFRQNIGVLNVLRVSRYDNVEYKSMDQYPDAESSSSLSLPKVEYAPGESITLSIPQNAVNYQTVSIERSNIQTTKHTPSFIPIPSMKDWGESTTPELEGHIVYAHPTQKEAQISTTRFVAVGKQARVYDGQRIPITSNYKPGSYAYYTTQLYGKLPNVLNAYDFEGNAIPMELESPFAKILPTYLPKLTVYCNEDDLRARSINAQREKVRYDYLSADTLAHSVGFMDVQPIRFYDLDQYTKFNTINEIIIEFVQGVRRKKVNGLTQLFTYLPDTKIFSNWPALVLLDGMPVYDINEILNYDAYLIKYVQIYNGRYTFGDSCAEGVISFISRKGRLSNYKLDEGSHLFSYSFPQNRPQFFNYDETCSTTTSWQPDITSPSVQLTAPVIPGTYTITLKGLDAQGNMSVEKKTIRIKK